MLGSTLLRYFSNLPDFDVTGTIRADYSSIVDSKIDGLNLIHNVDALVEDSWHPILNTSKPDIVINCIGVVKQLEHSNDPLLTIPLNAVFPHSLARKCAEYGSRLIHISTDCVFSGSKGEYLEHEFPDAQDLYGLSKRLGEVDYFNSITLRTSIIGHELKGKS